uniref:Reverse transcriptase domain-containing protein n=1 Tax=Oryzias melastigma TaxID=30732 RepID=A0A3B3CUR9_ORYME
MRPFNSIIKTCITLIPLTPTFFGCPLSPLLFILAIEPLAIAIRNDPSIHGIPRWGIEHKLSLYADDLLLFISRAEETIPNILNLLDKFGKVSGYKLNLHKSELLPINMSDSSLEKIQVLSASSIPGRAGKQAGLRLLRTRVGHPWPRFLYLFQCLPIYIPNTYFKELDSIISSFIWNGKKPRLRKEYLPLSLSYVMGAPLPLSEPLTIHNPVVRDSIKIIKQFRKHFGFLGMSLFTLIASHPSFPPSLSYTTFQRWHQAGLKCFNDLFAENQLASFQQLSNKYNFSPSHFFRNLRHYMMTSISDFPNKPPKNVLDDIFIFNPTQKKSIKKILNMFPHVSLHANH